MVVYLIYIHNPDQSDSWDSRTSHVSFSGKKQEKCGNIFVFVLINL